MIDAEATADPGAAADPSREQITRLCPTCLHDGVLEKTLERARAAEAKLAAIYARCRVLAGNPECPECGRGEALVRVADILAMTGTGGDEGSG